MSCLTLLAAPKVGRPVSPELWLCVGARREHGHPQRAVLLVARFREDAGGGLVNEAVGSRLSGALFALFSSLWWTWRPLGIGPK
jgi:hypothetical protein